MAIQFCECGGGLSNLGSSSCPSIMKTIKKHIFVSMYDSSGNRNSIKLTDFDIDPSSNGKLSDSYIADKLKFGEPGGIIVDPSKKWYPTPSVYKNVESTRTDSTTEEFSDGSIYRLEGGVNTFKGELVEMDATLASRIQSNGCSEFGVYEVDIDGSIRGELSADGTELYPIKINKGSLDSYEVPPVEGSSTQRIMVTFQYDGTVSEVKLMKIANTQIESNLLQISSMIDGTISETVGKIQSTTTLYLDYFVKFGGTFGAKIPIQGKLDEINDWAIYNETSSKAVTITELEELTKGNYTFTITSETPVAGGDVLAIQYIPSASSKSSDQEFQSNTLEITIPV